MMTNSQTFAPEWLSSPGDTIKDLLEDRDLSIFDFSQLIGQPKEEALSLLEGRKKISISIAKKIKEAVGGTVEFWMSREYLYRQDVVRLYSSNKNWLDEFPIDDMINYNWIDKPDQAEENLLNCFHFYNITNVSEWYDRYSNIYQKVAFRKSSKFEMQPGSVISWLRKGEIEAKKIQCNTWNKKSFKESLLQIRKLTKQKDSQRFLPTLQKICASSGVALVIVRVPSGCPISGATFFTTNGKAVLMLSFRYLTDDHFWFTFFHEAGHLLLHSKNEIFLEDEEREITSSKDVKEEEANIFAENILIPLEFRPEFFELKPKARDIIRYAIKIGVSPGIIVGQLQFHGKITFRQLNSLKRRYKWDEKNEF